MDQNKKPVRKLDWWITRVYAPIVIAWVTWISKGLVEVEVKLGEVVGQLKQLNQVSEVKELKQILLDFKPITKEKIK